MNVISKRQIIIYNEIKARKMTATIPSSAENGYLCAIKKNFETQTLVTLY